MPFLASTLDNADPLLALVITPGLLAEKYNKYNRKVLKFEDNIIELRESDTDRLGTFRRYAIDKRGWDSNNSYV